MMLPGLHSRTVIAVRALLQALPWLGGALLAACSSEADLPKRDLGDTVERAAPLAPGVSQDDPWWCLGERPSALSYDSGQAAWFILPVVEWASGTPLAGQGLAATLCPGAVFNCSPPLAQRATVGSGMLTPQIQLPRGASDVPVFQGFDGFIRFEVPQPPTSLQGELFLPVNYFLGGVISGQVEQGPPILMAKYSLLQSIVAQSFPGFNPNVLTLAGTLLTEVRDCNGRAVSDARVEIQAAGEPYEALQPFQLPASRILVGQTLDQPLLTSSSGMVGYLDVPPGTVQLTAYRQGDAEPFARVQVGSVAAQISWVVLRPEYLQGANLSGTPALAYP